jgi:hypothetical protein
LTRGVSTRFITIGSRASRALNRGVLPAEYFALPEQSIGAAIPDVLTLELTAGTEEANGAAGLAVAHVWGEIAFRATSGAQISSVLWGFLSDARRCF